MSSIKEPSPLIDSHPLIVKKRVAGFGSSFFVYKSVVLAHLSEALAAIHGSVGLGLKGDLCFATASSAGSGEILSGATGGILSSVTASLAALGLILEASFSIEFLLTGGKHELVATVFAN